MSTTDALMDQLQAALAGHDRDAFAPFCTNDVHYEDPLTPKPLTGPAALGKHAARLWKPFPDARIEKTSARLTSDDGRYIMAPIKLTATHRGELEGLPPTDRFVVVHAVFYCELDPERAKLWRIRGFYDLWGAGTQLGIFPKPGSLGEKALLMLRGFGLRAGG